MFFKKNILILCCFFCHSIYGENTKEAIYPANGFFRFSFDKVSMPNAISPMGLLGINFFQTLAYQTYFGIGAYGALTGTQGGLFTLGIAGGWQPHLFRQWWGDVGLFVGGGGGRSSLVGGGLMLGPHIGLQYHFALLNAGIQYDYIAFPDGKIHSQQIGVHFDFPTTFYYLKPNLSHCHRFYACDGKFLTFDKNNFGIFLQTYFQKKGSLNIRNQVQDNTIKLVGAEINHFFLENIFWWVKTSGAFAGIPNGYMDVLGGFGYEYYSPYGFALLPQFGIGAGGGGVVDTAGGLLINPSLGLQIPIVDNLAFKINSGYLWSLQGNLRAVPLTFQLLYHLDFAKGSKEQSRKAFNLPDEKLGWRIQVFNQSYFHPQRSQRSVISAINLIGVQIDQIFNPYFFFVYQATGAYKGDHSGGYATGMIGPGIQIYNKYPYQLFSELLLGAGGGGGLALRGGAIIELMIGMRYQFNRQIGLQMSIGELKALKDHLNTVVMNVGLTVRFDTLNQYRYTLNV